ncbi:hypothetical protein H072_10669 [Dactylellina haptotyla CBS 200.50]|uniref:Uncharacterized protein n=1 Tax=Dactylellina haptotyla (strain CBS 200.50) TaxID=1284197 RepID=S8A441_DACHA|nr:hypothetical protein H072_10669 [Dactylellina haptotyla CBS 200.50]
MEKTPFIRGPDYYLMIIVMGKVGHMEEVRKLFLSCLKHKTSRCQGLLRSVIDAYLAFMVQIGRDPNAASHGYVPACLGGKSWNLVLCKRPNAALQDIEQYFAKHECPTTTVGAYEEISFITNILLNVFPSWPSSTIFRPYLWMGVNAGFSTLLRKQFRELINPPPRSTYIIAIRKKFASLWFGEMIFVAGRARDFEWVEEITELFSEYLREGLFSAATLAKEVSSGKIGKELEEASVFADYVWAAATCGRWDVAFGMKKALLEHWSGNLYLQIRIQFLRKLKGRINKDPPTKDKDWAAYLTRERCNAEEQQRIQAAIFDGLRVNRLQQEAKGLRTRIPKFGTTPLI